MSLHPLHAAALARIAELEPDPDEYARWDADPENEWERWTEHCREHGVCYYREGPEELHWAEAADGTSTPLDLCPDPQQVDLDVTPEWTI